ncbi:DUF6644 family protein [Aquirhabdus parva]|uniref:DUF6644 domain-containing protein n=1 Tax=Aquirhabdus parva TaxID=2283318 RepID=A0A345PBA6_9GAMM|nr:DUF6644 family protein [Aquirhabdus parva]AXI04565.1 hypothetical protein HYN46_05435 [Aquirhabdus parva]
MSQLIEYAQRIEDSQLATALHESLYAFPLLEGTHLLGLALSVGLLAIIDLRLLGLILTDIPKEQLLKQLRPWVLWGFVGAFLTGIVLLASEAASILSSPPFAFKLLFILLAGINAVIFEFKAVRAWIFKGADSVSRDKWAGGISLGLWSLVIISGRLIPYFIPHG